MVETDIPIYKMINYFGGNVHNKLIMISGQCVDDPMYISFQSSR